MTPRPDFKALEQAIAAPPGEFRRDYIQVKDLRVSFDGFVAVDGVDLVVTSGDLRFLIGPNGAGKTTLIDAITGLAKATGSASFGGVELLGLPSHKIVRASIGRTFQTASVIEELSVLQILTSPPDCIANRANCLAAAKASPRQCRSRSKRSGWLAWRPRRPEFSRMAEAMAQRSACCSSRMLVACCWTNQWPV